jgi:uncharacterized tellurite resistance protein B-like protein
MPLTSIFSSNQRDKSEAVFASLYKLSQVDGVISADEQDVLDRMAKRLEILDARRKEIKENPEAFAIIPPIAYDERITYLYDLVKIVVSDGFVDDEEKILLNKMAVSLGFDNEEVVDKAVDFIAREHDDLEDFIEDIKKVRK